MELTALIAHTLIGHVDSVPRLSAFTSGALLVVATYEHENGDTYDEYITYPFHDEASRLDAYVEAKRWYEQVANAQHVYSASLAVTLDSTDY